jgi:AraC family transcriptional regulator
VQRILVSKRVPDLNKTADLRDRAALDARPMTPRRAIAGVGQVLLWSGGSLWIGRDAGRVERHAHHAIQITLSMDSHLRLAGADGEWQEHLGAVVPPHLVHRFDGCGQRTAMLFVEPETGQGRALLERHGTAAITDLSAERAEALVAPLRSAYLAGASKEALLALAQMAIAALAGHVPAEVGVDPRIARAIAWVRSRLDLPISLDEAAAIANLSPSRFRHLFVAQTGVSFRAYLLWARVGAAVGAAMNGQSWTAAAQDAGFADSAHLSRTCRRMFGFAPASLIAEPPARAATSTGERSR